MDEKDIEGMSTKMGEAIKSIASPEIRKHATSVMLLMMVGMLETRGAGSMRSPEDFMDALEALGDAVKIARTAGKTQKMVH